jgi:microcystin-dependent protein
MDEYMAKIVFFGFEWCPRDYMACNGQLINIESNSALFSLLGTNFGGNGTINFALPDLRGRAMVGQGSSAFGTFIIGNAGGNTTTSLTTANMPSHTHAATLNLTNNTTTVKVSTSDGSSQSAGSRNGTLGGLTSETDRLYNNETPTFDLNVAGNTVEGTVTNGSTGSGQSFNNMQPYLVLNPCIVTVGLYPPRT